MNYLDKKEEDFNYGYELDFAKPIVENYYETLITNIEENIVPG